MGRIAMLTTTDNPFDPFENFMAWDSFDRRAGHNSTALLARIAIVSHELSDPDFNLAIEKAIDEICDLNVSGVHVKVVKDLE